MNINLDSAKDTLCKNILIYGYCKFENKGCAFSHNINRTTKPANQLPNSNGLLGLPDASLNESTSATPSLNTKEKKKFNFNTPSFQPATVSNLSSKFSSFSPKLDEIPTFVPGTQLEMLDGAVSMNQGANSTSDFPANGTSAPIGTPSATSGSVKRFNPTASSFTPSFEPSQQSTPVVNNPYMGTPTSAGAQSINSLAGSDMYYTAPTNNYPLNYHLYAPAPPPRLTIPLPPHETNGIEMFLPNDLRETLQRRNEATLAVMGGRSNLPDNVNEYHSLMPIDLESKSRVWGIKSAIFKVFSNVDGNAYILRKIDHEDTLTIDNKMPFKSIEKWKKINNSNLVKIQDCFTTIAFGGNKSQLCCIYDYYPNANTLLEQHFSRKLGGKLEPITEDLIWIYIIQISNVLGDIHKKGLAARESMDLSKIIVTTKNRIKLNGCGISDILNYGKEDIDIKQLQLQDFRKFGQVIIELAYLMVPSFKKQNKDIDSIKGYVSKEMIEVIEILTDEQVEQINLDKFNEKYLSKRMMSMINGLQDSNDYIENQLGKELENGRLFRLITKINFILDHPKLNWQENDRIYLIKLFNDYIFHQTDSTNKPVVDLSRVLIKLNKLDCGVDERFMLITPDDKLSILISYKELRDIIDSSFRELTK